MNEQALIFCAGLALAQSLGYRMKVREIGEQFWFLWAFYFVVFFFASVVHFVCVYFSIIFYQLPLLSAVLFIVTLKKPSWRLTFKKEVGQLPDFYVLTTFWLGFAWSVFGVEIHLFGAFVWAFVAVLFLLIILAIKERSELLDCPFWFSGSPILWFSTGLLLLILSGV